MLEGDRRIRARGGVAQLHSEALADPDGPDPQPALAVLGSHGGQSPRSPYGSRPEDLLESPFGRQPAGPAHPSFRKLVRLEDEPLALLR
ncbi:hypothetical protein BE21_22615 [Sorangium cellulosum]|uniref:Uncharacterized protein n=1 Tax=Sorangium cellulosum TaxID=56 RepID=A0A150TVC5_SORCE|nr:hypothetical protein BE21_22615 [Sorangium cellulosum]